MKENIASLSEKAKLRIAFVSSYDARDRRVFSGIPYYSIDSLSKQYGTIHYIGPYSNKFLLLFLKGISFFIRKVSKKRFDHYTATILARRYGAFFTRKLKNEKFDLIFTCAGTAEIAYLKTEIPIVMLSDATFPNLMDYYAEYTNLLKISKKMGMQIEKKAFEKASILLFSSDWAAQSAKDNYKIDSEKIYVTPFGANLDEIPEREKILAKRKSNTCRLLFLGIDWERKGGRIAFETLISLKERGVQATLTSIGTTPPSEYSDKDFIVIPFLDKNNSEGRKEFNKYLLESDFLILPTRADCTPMVFAEVNAFGLPSFTTNTGGVAGVIHDGMNGILHSLDAGAKEYADTVENIFLSDELYYTMRKNSRDLFEQKLNWEGWGKKVHEILSATLA